METALAAADRVISERGELCYPYYLKGVTHMQQKKYDEAVAAYKKAIDYTRNWRSGKMPIPPQRLLSVLVRGSIITVIMRV